MRTYVRFIDLNNLMLAPSTVRLQAARAVVATLTPTEREEMAAELISMIEAARTRRETAEPKTTATSTTKTTATTKPMSKTDRAEAFIKSHPGCTTREVAEYIDQKPKVAGTTLYQLAESRGSVERRDGKWYPVNVPEAKPKQLNLATDKNGASAA